MGELWAIPTMLRTGLLELLIDAVATVTHLEVPTTPAAREVPDPVRLSEGVSPDTIAAHCIRSLRVVANQDWEDFFEQVSQVEVVLREDPADVYRRMTFKSRDQYRKVVEELALNRTQ